MDEHMYILIAKALNQEATAEEQLELDSWLKQDAKNMTAYAEMKALWSESDVLFKAPEFDTNAAWNKVSAKTVDAAVPTRKVIAFKPWYRVSLAAAAVLLVVLAVRYFTSSNMEVVTASEGLLAVELPDHSHVTLHKGSTIRYPKDFTGEIRNVSLEGDAFFEVQRDEQHPFVIDANSVDVQVLGTSFYVSASDGVASVTVATGKVSMTSKKSRQQLILTPGNKGVLKEDQLRMATDTNFVYYKEGVLNLSGVSLAHALEVISTVKNVPIVMDSSLSPALKEQIVEISFKAQPLEEMLKELCLITNTRWLKDKEIYRIFAK
jgi:transmembrane sensor